MRDTHFFLPEEKLPRLAAVYRSAENGGLRRLRQGPIEKGPLVFSTSYHVRGPRTYFSGGAGLVSTAYDYYRFSRMLLNGGELEGVRLLNSETVEQMTTNQMGDLSVGDGKFGFGFSLRTRKDAENGEPVGVFGGGGFFFTEFWVDPEYELIGIFMAQLRPNRRSEVDDAFRRTVYRSILEN
jgi:CubicO group peptidase (beta-lactamase class C family)